MGDLSTLLTVHNLGYTCVPLTGFMLRGRAWIVPHLLAGY